MRNWKHKHPSAENKHTEAAFEETPGSPEVGAALHKADNIQNARMSPQISNTSALESCLLEALEDGVRDRDSSHLTMPGPSLIFQSYVQLDITIPHEPYEP